MVKPTVNALFLSKLGADYLPYGYLLVAVVAIVSSYFYTKALRFYSLKRITILTLLMFCLIFVGLSFLIQFSLLNYFTLFFYYVIISLFAVLCTSQFWILANMVYNVREAKRLFGFIGSGAIAGGIFGGYLTTLLASNYGNRVVMIAAAGLLLMCVPLLFAVWKLRVRKLNSYIRKQRKSVELTGNMPSFRLVLNSKHLTIIAGIVGMGVIIAKLVDFQFSDFAHQSIPDSDELASFFGFWFSSFNVAALVIQLFITNRLLSYLGVTSTLLVLPLSIAIGSLLFLAFPELWVLILLKGMDGSLKQSVNKAATELSILPIPFHIKNQAKSFIDIVVDSIATGIAGFILIMLVRRLELATYYITILTILLLFVWLLLIYKLRDAYFNSFRTNLQNSINYDDSSEAKKQRKESTIKSAIRILNTGTEEDILSLMDRLNDFKLISLRTTIIKLLDHPSNKVKIAAIEQLYFYRKGTAFDKVKDLIQIKDDEVVFAAMQYLLVHTNVREDKIFHDYLDHENDYIANAALLSLAKEAGHNASIAKRYRLQERIEAKIRKIESSESETRKEEIAEVLMAIGYFGMPKYFDFIESKFNHEKAYVVRYAIKAAGTTADPNFIDPLLFFLKDKKYRKRAVRALKNFGPSVIKVILVQLENEKFKNKEQRFIPKIAEAFNSLDAIKLLFKLLRNNDVLIRLKAAQSLNNLKSKNEGLRFNRRRLSKIIMSEISYYRNSIISIKTLQEIISESLVNEPKSEKELQLLSAREHLIATVDYQMRLSQDCIFKLLSLNYRQSDIDVAYHGLTSESQEARVNALEFLDNLIHLKFKGHLFPLLEFNVLKNENIDYETIQNRKLSEKACLARLLNNRGRVIKMDVLKIIQLLNDPIYLSNIVKLRRHRSNEVKTFAFEIIRQLRLKRRSKV